MKKKLTILLFGLTFAVSFPSSASAQKPAGKGIPVNPEAKMGLDKFVPTPFLENATAKAPVHSALLDRNVEFLINFESRNVKYGLYKVDLTDTIRATSFRLQGNSNHSNFAANQGGAYYNGVFHCNNGDEYYGLFFVEDFQFVEANNWNLYRRVDLVSSGFVADVQTLDPITNKVYGAFCDEKGEYEWELCEVDLDRHERKLLAKAQHRYLAMGIDRRGRWFGITGIGELYEISRTDGTEKFVGDTGLKVTAYDGAASYHQSGCFDPATDTFFWSRADMTGKCEIYAVNVETAESELVSTYADITLPYFMQTVEGHAANGAPAQVSNLSVAFSGASTTGTVSFTLPQQSYDGTALSGSLTYQIEVDGVVVLEGTAAAGAAVNETVTLAEGVHRLDVLATNAAGRGALVTRPLAVGLDTPQVAEVRYVANGRSVSLDWDAARAEFNGNLGDVTYTVVRYPDNKVVASNVTDTRLVDALPAGAPTSYYYGVTAGNTAHQGHETLTSAFLGGDALEPPFIKFFSNDTKDDEFTFIDANGDGISWETSIYWDYARYCNASQLYNSSTMLGGDDWLVLPHISLKAGKEYYFYYAVYTGLGRDVLASYEVRLGRYLSPESLTQSIFTYEIPQDKTTPETVVHRFSVAEDGDYYIGFHSTCPALSNMIALKGIGLEEVENNRAPGKVTGLEIIPNLTGGYTTELRFVAPTVTFGNTRLSNITRILVQRDNVVVKAIENPTPGQTISVTDDTMTESDNGVHRYVVTAENEYGQGEPETGTSFVGVDRPTVSGMTGSAVEQGKGILISWTPVSTQGVSGGYVDPSKVTYYIYEEAGSSYRVRGQVTGQTSYFYEMDPNEGAQREMGISIGASNLAGDSPNATHVAYVIVGAPYSLPYREDFASNFTGNPLYWGDSNGSTQPSCVQGDSFDGDGRCYQWSGTAQDSYFSFNTGKLNVKGTANPTLAFASKFASTGSIEVYVQTPDGKDHLVETINASDAGSWVVQLVDLGDYRDENYIYVKLRMKSSSTARTIRIDDLNILDMYARNLAATVTAPADVKAGTPADVAVEVRNTGSRDQSDYTVRLYDDGQQVYEQSFEATLSTLQRNVVTIPYSASVFKAGGKVTLRAEVEAGRDDDEEDNMQEAEVTVVANDAPQPEQLASAAQDGGVSLSWQAPSNLSREITESFEGGEFTDFDTSGITSTNHGGVLGGGWTLWGGFGSTDKFSIDYPNKSSRSSWVVFNNATAPGSGITPHSGDRFLVSFDITGSAADCWLISPEMSGDAQTIRFFATEPAGAEKHETFNVLVSSTDTNLGTGSLVGRDDNLGSFSILKTLNTTGNGWDEFSVDLPAGTKYFAFRNISRAMAKQLALDDITYTSVFGTIVGYNVYGDQQLLGTVADGTTVFTLATDDAKQYAVTARYASGQESMPVYVASPTGIRTLRYHGVLSFDIYSLDGRLVRRGATSLGGLTRGVYIVNGQKVVIR